MVASTSAKASWAFSCANPFAGANVFYHMEKYEEAIADCERAIQVDPTFTKVSSPCCMPSQIR